MISSVDSPKIEDISWGRTRVQGHQKVYKDVKLFPGGAREWNWNETGTAHTPGIQPADVEELIQKGAEIIVLGRGFNQRLQVKQETLQMLEEKDIQVFVLGTEAAVQTYNQLAESKLVGALIHSTC